MRPGKGDFKQAMLAGFVATAILTVLMYAAPLAGLPLIDLAAALGRPFAKGSLAMPLTSAWWMGLAIFFLFGSVASPYVFVYAFPGLLGGSWLRGMEWGVFVWVFGGVAVMTAMGLGFDEEHFTHPFSTFFASLAGHMLYGAILGVIAGRVLGQAGQVREKHA